jgi:type I restriction enzyme R subunit
MPPPEQVARQKIDTMLLDAGWTIQNFRQLNLAGKGVALREVPLKSGRCDYLLLINRKPVGVVEAKKVGTRLSNVADQSRHYGENLPDFLATDGILPFYYESTGAETFFRDERDPHPRSRPVFAFHRPETLAEVLAKSDTLRYRLAQLRFAHPLATDGMRDCQIEAITNLEESFVEGHPRALIQMATGAGKTFAACAFTYRLIKYAGAKRIHFLVDRANLGRQAVAEFQQFVTPDGRKFTELYNVQHLTSNKLDDVCRVTICTIQRLYSMLRGEDLEEDFDEKSGFEIAAADQRPKDVVYNPAIPIETFDFIVTDECQGACGGKDCVCRIDPGDALIEITTASEPSIRRRPFAGEAQATARIPATHASDIRRRPSCWCKLEPSAFPPRAGLGASPLAGSCVVVDVGCRRS